MIDIPDMHIQAHYQFPEVSLSGRKFCGWKTCAVLKSIDLNFYDVPELFFLSELPTVSLPPLFPQLFSNRNWTTASTQAPKALTLWLSHT